MAKGPTFDTIVAAFASASKLNANFAAITTSFDNTLSLDGSTPNAMAADLDMGANDILNAGGVAATDITIGGVSLESRVAAAASSATDSASSATDSASSATASASSAVDASGSAALSVQDITRNEVTTTTIDPSIDFIRTSGFAAVGDGGAAEYKRIVSEPSHNLKITSLDGAFWELVPENGMINVLQAGAVGDGVTDDATAIQSCIEFQTLHPTRDEYATTARIIFPATEDFYLCNAMLTVNRTTILEGAVPGGRSLGAVTLKFADSVPAGIWLQHPGGLSAPGSYTPAKLYSGWRAEIRNLALEPVNAGMVDYGVIHNITATFDHVEVFNFKKAGFFAHGQSSGDHLFGDPNGVNGTGTMFGNTNISMYIKCMARNSTAGHGFAAQGNNTQIMHYLECDASGNKGCGFRDNSSIGNIFTDCHTQGNTIKILHNAVFYMPIITHTSSATDEPGVGANWRDFWVEVVATTDDGSWTISTLYLDAGGYNVIDTGAAPTFTGCYSEGGIEFGIIPRGKTLILGGVIAASGRVSRHHDGFRDTQIYGSLLVNTPPLWQGESDDGVDTFGSSLGQSSISVPDFFVAGHSDDPQHAGANNLLKFKWSSLGPGGGSYEWLYDGTKEIMAFTPDQWDSFSLDPADVTLGDFDTAGFAYFEDGFFFGGRPTMMVSSNSLAIPVSPTYLPKGAKTSFTSNTTGLPHMIHCITGGKVGVLSWNAVAGTIANTDTRTGPEITAGVVVAAFEPLTPRAAAAQTNITDADVSHDINATFSDTEVEATLNALAVKINSILDILEAHGLMAT